MNSEIYDDSTFAYWSAMIHSCSVYDDALPWCCKCDDKVRWYYVLLLCMLSIGYGEIYDSRMRKVDIMDIFWHILVHNVNVQSYKSNLIGWKLWFVSLIVHRQTSPAIKHSVIALLSWQAQLLCKGFHHRDEVRVKIPEKIVHKIKRRVISIFERIFLIA